MYPAFIDNLPQFPAIIYAISYYIGTRYNSTRLYILYGHFHYTIIFVTSQGPETLSSAMRRVLSTDQVAPVLLDPHLKALDRRLVIILKTVYKCLQKNKFIGKVVVDDGF